MHPSSTFQADTNTTMSNTINDNNNEKLITDNDDIEITRLLNVLNWSPLDDINTNKPTVTNDENELKSKTNYNAVQISIELQKKMLK